MRVAIAARVVVFSALCSFCCGTLPVQWQQSRKTTDIEADLVEARRLQGTQPFEAVALLENRLRRTLSDDIFERCRAGRRNFHTDADVKERLGAVFKRTCDLSPITSKRHLPYLEALAGAYAVVKEYHLASAARFAVSDFHTQHQESTTTRLMSSIGLVDSLVLDSQMDAAAKVLAQAVAMLRDRIPNSANWPAVWRVSSAVDDCRGDVGAALSSFLHSLDTALPATDSSTTLLPLKPFSSLDSSADVKLALEYMHLLWRQIEDMHWQSNVSSLLSALGDAVFRDVHGNPSIHTIANTRTGTMREAASVADEVSYRPVVSPALVRRVHNATWLQGEVHRVARAVLQRGPWEHANQLPRTYTPGLTSQPWHSTGAPSVGCDSASSTRCKNGTHAASQAPAHTSGMDDSNAHSRSPALPFSYPALAAVESVLRLAADNLTQEYSKLLSQGALLPENECINSARHGSWSYFTVQWALVA